MSVLLATYQRGIGFSQSCSTGVAPLEEHFWGVCKEQVSNR